MQDATPVHYIEAITERYEQLGYDPYRWYKADSDPALTPLSKDLSECRLGMLSTLRARSVSFPGGGL